MRAADLEDVLYATPFIPFDFHIGGKVISVGHPENVALNPSKTIAVMVPDDHIHVVEIARISSLTLHRRKKKAA
ncbi:MAG TPA: hypothetical protein VNT99_03640 [Methylomirabilota bacterium]|nr:hypothetical protein [Methylomirabilota bacterium]